MLATSTLDYHLPPELIAARPVEPRDASKLLVVSRSDPARLEHRAFRDLPEYLRPDDLLVFNTSSVLPARIAGRRADTGGGVGGLFLHVADRGLWRMLLHAGGRLREGMVIALTDAHGAASSYQLSLEARDAEAWLVRLSAVGAPLGLSTEAPEVLAAVGATPLPPYILKVRREAGDQIDDAADRRWYQTVYADPSSTGSVAAPTAGLHFTPELLRRCFTPPPEGVGAGRADVTLHVGAGTFKPVDVEHVEEHPIHAEWVTIPDSTRAALAATRARGGRVVSVGTTSVRALESDGGAGGGAFETRLLVTPGFEFQWTDALITNFHLPRSTLLALVAALFPEGVPRLMEIYREAIQQRYRFYSYGDAMLILP